MTEAGVAGFLRAVLSITRDGAGNCKYLCEGGLVWGYPKCASQCSGISNLWEQTRHANSQAPTHDRFKTDSLGIGAQAFGFEQASQMIFQGTLRNTGSDHRSKLLTFSVALFPPLQNGYT